VKETEKQEENSERSNRNQSLKSKDPSSVTSSSLDSSSSSAHDRRNKSEHKFRWSVDEFQTLSTEYQSHVDMIKSLCSSMLSAQSALSINTAVSNLMVLFLDGVLLFACTNDYKNPQPVLHDFHKLSCDIYRMLIEDLGVAVTSKEMGLGGIYSMSIAEMVSGVYNTSPEGIKTKLYTPASTNNFGRLSQAYLEDCERKSIQSNLKTHSRTCAKGLRWIEEYQKNPTKLEEPIQSRRSTETFVVIKHKQIDPSKKNGARRDRPIKGKARYAMEFTINTYMEHMAAYSTILIKSQSESKITSSVVICFSKIMLECCRIHLTHITVEKGPLEDLGDEEINSIFIEIEKLLFHCSTRFVKHISENFTWLESVLEQEGKRIKEVQDAKTRIKQQHEQSLETVKRRSDSSSNKQYHAPRPIQPKESASNESRHLSSQTESAKINANRPPSKEGSCVIS
jgi:hypothetical protein